MDTYSNMLFLILAYLETVRVHMQYARTRTVLTIVLTIKYCAYRFAFAKIILSNP